MKAYITIILILIIIKPALAQDILGGEMRLTHLTNYTYEIQTFLYTKTGFGIQHQGTATNLSGDVTEWHFTGNHTFPGPGTHEISYADSFRVAGVLNIINSSNEKIILKASTEINPFSGPNSSPVFHKKQTEVFTDGVYIYFDASGIDPDGDTLSYSLVSASSTNYTFPPGAAINPITGLFQLPINNDINAINIEINEWRNGILIGRTYREITIDGATVTTNTELNNNIELRIYPNPTTGILNIESENEIEKIIVYDILGKEVRIFKNPDKIIDLKINKNGIYFLRIEDNNSIIWYKILVKE